MVELLVAYTFDIGESIEDIFKFVHLLFSNVLSTRSFICFS